MRPNILCNVAILAGGSGSRLKSRSGYMPKPMVKINGKPILEHQINLCLKYGFTKIALLVHYQFEVIKEYFGNGAKFGVELVYVVEREARGTAGALFDALDFMESRFLVLYGDTYADINLKNFWDFDSKQKSVGTLFLHPNDHPHDSDLMEIGEDGEIVRVLSYPHLEGEDFPNLVNAALYILNRDALLNIIPRDIKTDLAKHTFPSLLSSGKKIYGYISPEYIKDMGTPERLDKVEKDINQGLPEKLSGRNFRAAVFMDRDGTISMEVNHLNSPNQLCLIDGVSDAIRRVNSSGMLAIGITNQPVLARGELTHDGLKRIHARLDSLLGRRGAYLDRIYICPHHPDRGYKGEVPELKIECDCRKPKTGLFDLAVQELNISRRESWMVGDTTSDILAGKRAGLRTILVRTGYSGRDFKYDVDPDFIAADLNGAIDWILNGYPNAVLKLMPLVLSAVTSKVILIGGASRSGKSSAAHVLAELLMLMGKNSHVLSLDGWLRSAEERQEGAGVLGRYKLNIVVEQVKKIILSNSRVDIEYPQYDRKLKQIIKSKKISVFPSDILIIEGVPALLDEHLFNLANLRINIDIDDDLRIQRLQEEYLWRGEQKDEFMSKIMSREIDEVSLVKSVAHKADYQINLYCK